MKKYPPLPALAVGTMLLAALAGCAVFQKKAELPPPEEGIFFENFNLDRALQEARKKRLDVLAYETLQQQAGEFKSSRMQYQLSNVIADLRIDGCSEELINPALDQALIYAHLLGTTRPDDDLIKIQRLRSGQLLDLSVAAALAKLDEACILAPLNQIPDYERSERELEVRTLTGASPVSTARFDFSSLPQPFPLKEKIDQLQRFAAWNRPESAGTILTPGIIAEIKKRHENDKAMLLVLASRLYNLPKQLQEQQILRPEVNWREIAKLTCGAAIALQVEEDCRRLEKRYEAFRLRQLQNQVNRRSGVDPELIRQCTAWRLAYFRLRTDLGLSHFPEPIPELPTLLPPELTETTAAFFEFLTKLRQ